MSKNFFYLALSALANELGCGISVKSTPIAFPCRHQLIL
jgi:hypothetical protein